MSGPIWITEQDVVTLMSLPQAIDALRAGLREEADGRAANLEKSHVTWDGGSTLHVIGAVLEGAGLAGTKTWAHTANGATPLLTVIDSRDGSVVAIIEAFALGQMRTGAISGVGTDALAAADASTMAMIGSGKQSLAQVAAIAAVRRIRKVTVWSPTPEKREALSRRIEATLHIEASAAGTLEQALDGAKIVTLATRAKAPFLMSSMLAPGVHINAIGAITPERAEFEPALLDRAAIIGADSLGQVRALSREFACAFGQNEEKWRRVTPLCQLVASKAARPDGADLTLFKAMGMGIADLSLGAAVLNAALAAGIGRPIPRPVRITPRLGANLVQEGSLYA